MSAKYVRETYKVDYKKGDRLLIDGRAGELVSFPDQYLGVRFDGEKHTSRCHPTWKVQKIPTREEINAQAVRKLKLAADGIEQHHDDAVKHEWYSLGGEGGTRDLYDGPGLMAEYLQVSEADAIVMAVGAMPALVELLHHVVNVVEVAGYDGDWDESPLDDLVTSALALADKILGQEVT